MMDPIFAKNHPAALFVKLDLTNQMGKLQDVAVIFIQPVSFPHVENR